MPRYYFHLKSPTRPVRDRTGVELSGLEAAHWHAMRLAYRLREHAAETGEDWVIAVADETGASPLAVLPSAVPMLRAPAAPPEHLNFLLLSPWGRGLSATILRSKSFGGKGEGERESVKWESPSPVSLARADLSPLGRGVKAPQTLATFSPRCRRALTASAPGNPGPRP
jgi:hypothetical protein